MLRKIVEANGSIDIYPGIEAEDNFLFLVETTGPVKKRQELTNVFQFDKASFGVVGGIVPNSQYSIRVRYCLSATIRQSYSILIREILFKKEPFGKIS